jgi:malonyl-CoA O-methyltransferase
MEPDSTRLDIRHVRRRFDRAAARFDDADFVYRRSFDDLMERLLPLRIEPSVILDLGAATGTGSRVLAKRFRKSRVISADSSLAMLAMARSGRSWLARTREVQMDATGLALKTGSVDLVIANMLLPWINDLPACFKEIARVLRKGGVFAFATLGPDSLADVRDAFADSGHVHDFADMHVIGDALVRSGFADPVLDVDRLTITWQDRDALRRDHVASGAGNSVADRTRGLTGKGRMPLGQFDGDLAAEFELVYGHAWGAGPRMPAGEFHVEPGSIGRKARP